MILAAHKYANQLAQWLPHKYANHSGVSPKQYFWVLNAFKRISQRLFLRIKSKEGPKEHC